MRPIRLLMTLKVFLKGKVFTTHKNYNQLIMFFPVLTSPMKRLTLAASVFLLANPAFAYTDAEVEAECGSPAEVSKATPGSFTATSKQVGQINLQYEQCVGRLQRKAQQQAEIDAVPTGGVWPGGASVNGQDLIKCSHGRPCHYRLLEAMRSGM